MRSVYPNSSSVRICPDTTSTPSESPRSLVVKAKPDAVVNRTLDHRRPQAAEKTLHQPLSTVNLDQGVEKASVSLCSVLELFVRVREWQTAGGRVSMVSNKRDSARCCLRHSSDIDHASPARRSDRSCPIQCRRAHLQALGRFLPLCTQNVLHISPPSFSFSRTFCGRHHQAYQSPSHLMNDTQPSSRPSHFPAIRPTYILQPVGSMPL